MHQKLQEAITWILAALVRVLQKMHRWIFAELRLPFKELSVSAPARILQKAKTATLTSQENEELATKLTMRLGFSLGWRV